MSTQSLTRDEIGELSGVQTWSRALPADLPFVAIQFAVNLSIAGDGDVVRFDVTDGTASPCTSEYDASQALGVMYRKFDQVASITVQVLRAWRDAKADDRTFNAVAVLDNGFTLFHLLPEA